MRIENVEVHLVSSPPEILSSFPVLVSGAAEYPIEYWKQHREDGELKREIVE